MASKATRKSTNCVIFGQPKVLSSSTLPSYEDIARTCRFERTTLLKISRKEPVFFYNMSISCHLGYKNLELSFNTDCVGKACQRYDQ